MMGSDHLRSTMKTRLGQALCTVVMITLVVTADAFAQVTRIDLQVVESPALDGQSFGRVGQYERLRSVVYGDVDPSDPRHREIVDLDSAPRNDAGRVVYRLRVLGQWFDGIRFYAAAASPRRSRRTWAGLR